MRRVQGTLYQIYSINELIIWALSNPTLFHSVSSPKSLYHILGAVFVFCLLYKVFWLTVSHNYIIISITKKYPDFIYCICVTESE